MMSLIVHVHVCLLLFLPFSSSQLMLQTWNRSIFADVRSQLLSAAMSFLYKERSGEAYDAQLVIGVRESFGE